MPQVLARTGGRAGTLVLRFTCAALLVYALLPSRVAASKQTHLIDRLSIRGAKRTQRETFLALLPRVPPARYDDAEVEEFARRLSNLAIFDHVAVERHGTQLDIVVREKWTLIPEFSLATGKSAADASVELGATEHNISGRGSRLEISVAREQRGFNFMIGLNEHLYGQRRWARGVVLSYATTSCRFEDGQGWLVNTPRLVAWTSSPPLLSRYLRYQTGLTLQHEQMTRVHAGEAPPQGYALQVGMSLTYDRYRWHDLVPRGLSMTITAGPGFLAPASQARHFADLTLRAALPLARGLVWTTRLMASVSTRGNPNASSLLGSIQGVRGLADSLYRNWAQAFVNLELRQAVPLLDRLAMQAVLFADAAEFQRLDAAGARAERLTALSFGAGLRLLPTFIAEAVLRLDVARLIQPNQVWFSQFGVTQYF
ncbi:MAG: hypothetical protein JWN04_1691 [Myxococcaceae bacterium]|nr:hypothetical protein [Myxococcaceae bacterium]